MESKIFLKIFILVFLIFICLFLLEISLRLTIPYNMTLRDVTQNSSNPEILYELKPNASAVFTGQYAKLPPTTINISSKGIRDYEYSLKKQEGVFRIIVLGDSVAFGWGVELEDTFSKYLERYLREYKNEKKYEVINFAVPGYNIVQNIATLEYKCLDYSPDLIILYIDSNDYKPLFNYFCPFPILKYVPNSFYKSFLFRWLLERIVYKIDRINSGEFKKGLVAADRAVNKLKDIIFKNRLKVLFCPDIQWAKDILKKAKLEIFIINSDTEALNNSCYRYKNDGHPNSKGHRKIAEEILKYLEMNGYI